MSVNIENIFEKHDYKVDVPTNGTLRFVNDDIYDDGILDCHSNIEKIVFQEYSCLESAFLPKSLKSLEILRCDTRTIPQLPPNLESLVIDVCTRIDQFPDLPESLIELNIQGHIPLCIPNLPKNLKVLKVMGNCIEKLPPLPIGLRSLKVMNTELTELPDLPPKLTTFVCMRNSEMNLLPILPSSLNLLQVFSMRSLIAISQLPRNLKIFMCNDCPRITKISNLPKSLEVCYIANLPYIKELPVLPRSLIRFSCIGCPSLKQYFSFTKEEENDRTDKSMKKYIDRIREAQLVATSV